MIRTFCFLVCLIVVFQQTVSLPASPHASLRSIEIAHYHSRQLNNTTTVTNTDPPIQNEATNPIPITQPNMAVDYPVVTKYEPQEKNEPEKLSIEDLKSKCQHLQKLLNLNRTNENQNRPSNHQYPETHARPIYVNPRPTARPQYHSTSRPNGFYITAQHPGPGDRRPSPTTPTPIKYIRLEPVILQRTILSDGRMVYYWHKSLPTAVEYPANHTQFMDNPIYQQPEGQQSAQHAYGYVPATSFVGQQSVYSPYPNGYYYPSLGQTAEEANGGFIEATTEATTTTEASYGYGLSNFIPFYGYASGDTTTTTTTEASVTNNPPNEKNSEGLVYAQQLRFVIPVPYDDNAADGQRQQYGFDQYAYYPKQLQPNTVNVRVPYSPTFHMIRAVAVPKVEGDGSRRTGEVE